MSCSLQSDSLGCALQSLSQNRSRHASGINFFFKEGVDSTPKDVFTPASNRGYLIGLSTRGNHRRSIVGQYKTDHFDYAENSIYIRRFEEDYKAQLRGSFSFALMEISPASLNEISDEVDLQGLTELKKVDANIDPVLGGLTSALFPTNIAEQSALFFDQLAVAIAWHLTRKYGNFHRSIGNGALRLSSQKEHRAKELLAASLHGDLSVHSIARECGLSSRAFLKAFKTSTGFTPSQWLVNCRLEEARRLMIKTNHTLAEIATLSGFQSQANFSRVFFSKYGETPKFWRDRRR